MGRGHGENGGKGTGNKKHKWWVQNRQGEVKNSIGNGEAKELMCTIHGHELRWGNCWWEGSAGQKGINGRKQWDNCNSIINKIYLKNNAIKTKKESPTSWETLQSWANWHGW